MINTNEGIALKDALLAISPLIKSLVDTFVTPKLIEFKERNKNIKENTFLPTEENFTEYYHRTFKKLIVVNTLVFNNSQRLLSDIFIPLTLSSHSKENLSTKVNGFPDKISDEFGNILITDTAGMGKSTLMKKVFIDILHRNLGIPIFIELRRLSKNKTLLGEIQEQLNSINKDFNSDLLLELLAEGGFIIILDGYDEITLSDRDKVTKDLQEFISKSSNNRFFITSRPEKALTSFGNFHEFKIEPLNKKEAFELLRKYDNQGTVSSLLIKKLQEKELDNIKEFLTNPLLVSLLFTAFEHKQAIPFKKYLFYRQVYDANFESHDLTKGDSYVHNKYSNLEIDDFHRVLRYLGFTCFKLQKIEFGKDELLKLISQGKTFCVGPNFKESDFLQDILRTVPLFTQDGNYYRWAHKSLQEYFAAQFIYLDSKDKQKTILERISNNANIEKFINILDLYYDMDYRTFRNIIEYNLLNDYEKHINSLYKNFNNEIPVDSIIQRKELMFTFDSILFRVNETDENVRFHNKNFSKMLDDYKKINGLNASGFSGVLKAAPFSQNIFSLHYQGKQTSLIHLLYKKNNNIVKDTLKSIERDISLKNITIIKNAYKILKVDDAIDNPLNNKEIFDDVNHFIASTRILPFTMDTKNALEALSVIRKSLKSENKEDFLIDGI